MVKEIPLNKGKVTLVDDEDYEMYKDHRWFIREGYVIGLGEVFKGKRLHRLIMNPPDGMVVDHRNGDPLDNRRENLRVCEIKGNARNRRPNTGYKYKGVRFTDGKWLARITVNATKLHLGYFASEEEAASAYNAAALHYYGEFAWLNEGVPTVEYREPRRRTNPYKGVSFHKRIGKWVAQIAVNRKAKQLGYFNTAEDARDAYLEMKELLKADPEALQLYFGS